MQPNDTLDSGGESHDEVQIPPEFVELTELRSISVDRRLGYFENERFVIVGYSEEGQEVFWTDGRSSGFGLGHWQFFVENLGPLATRRGIQLGGPVSQGTHVVVLDRVRRCTYATCRGCAERFLAKIHGTPVPKRRCLCASKGSQPRNPNHADGCDEASL